MDYNKKLESLANEFGATINHAVEVMDEYVATCIEKELIETIEEIDNLIDKTSKPKSEPKSTIPPQPNFEKNSIEEFMKFLNDSDEEKLMLMKVFLEELESLKRNLK